MANPNELERLEGDFEDVGTVSLGACLKDQPVMKLGDWVTGGALGKQVSGDHYKKFAIQPIEFTVKNKLDFLQGNVIKYTCRHKDKNGIDDINKAIHYLELIKELQYNG